MAGASPRPTAPAYGLPLGGRWHLRQQMTDEGIRGRFMNRPYGCGGKNRCDMHVQLSQHFLYPAAVCRRSVTGHMPVGYAEDRGGFQGRGGFGEPLPWQVFLSIFFLTAQKEYGPRRGKRIATPASAPVRNDGGGFGQVRFCGTSRTPSPTICDDLNSRHFKASPFSGGAEAPVRRRGLFFGPSGRPVPTNPID